jgi:hypothetical protein
VSRRPTPAQQEALEFVRKRKAAYRPSDCRRDVWGRCHDNGWLKQVHGMPYGISCLTPAGVAILDASKEQTDV